MASGSLDKNGKPADALGDEKHASTAGSPAGTPANAPGKAATPLADTPASDVGKKDFLADIGVDRRDEPSAVPRVGDRYKAFVVEPVSKPSEDPDEKFVAGADCGIGSEVRILFPGEGVTNGSPNSPTGRGGTGTATGELTIESRSGRPIGRVTGAVADKILEYRARGWEVTAHLTLITLDREQREFSTEAVVFCISPEEDSVREALLKFKKGLLRRIKRGENPKPQLSQKEFERVVRTRGEWCYTAVAREPELGKDEAFFKRRQSLADRVADLGMDHRIGCSIASIVIIAVIILLVLKLIGLF